MQKKRNLISFRSYWTPIGESIDWNLNITNSYEEEKNEIGQDTNLMVVESVRSQN